ncbi:MAG: hypothetical protein COA78_34495 [Blastopirellula sp.]|nr:MAG: hypothetical protein COA78_34495 [Blastopirellula sp.]
MKTVYLDLRRPINPPSRWDSYDMEILVPTLSAYAIEYVEFLAGHSPDMGYRPLVEGQDFELNNNSLIWHGFDEGFLSTNSLRLVIHHHGIRDYEALFPFVEDERYRKRLGQYYEEAEQVFETGAWLSYTLMCGALYEGVLGCVLENYDDVFHVLIQQAAEKGIITEEQRSVMNSARDARNLVHISRIKKEYVSRADAMDMRTTMDKVIYNFALTHGMQQEKRESKSKEHIENPSA